MNENINKGFFNKDNLKKTIGKTASEYSFVLIFVAILLVYLIQVAGGITWNGVMNILRHNAVVGIMALGMGIVIITKGIDLSVGSMLALCGVVSILVYNATGSILLTLLACLLSGALFGFFNGILIGKAKLPAFIVTLATMLMYRSIAQYATVEIVGTNLIKMDATIGATDALGAFGNSFVLTVPMTGIILILVTIVMVIITTLTKFGKSLYAVGSNEKAARLAGINVDWVIVSTYTITGLMVGIGAFLWLAMNTSIDPATTGDSNEMYAIAAVVIGGISMSGGKGKIVGIIFGAMSYGVIDKIIVAAGLDTLIRNAVKGTVLILAIAVQLAVPHIKAYIANVKQRRQIAISGQ